MKSSIKLHPGRWTIGLIALMTVALAACGGAEQATTAPAGPTPTVANVIPAQPVIKDVPATPVPAAAAEPTAVPEVMISAKDTVRIVTEGEPNSVGFATGLCTANILDIVCEDMVQDPLTWIDNETFEVVPLTGVESWAQTAPDTWRFKLRPGIKFHNGAEWNAEQAAFWIDFGGDAETGGNNNANAFSYHGVQDGVVIDPLTMDIVCDGACPILPRKMTYVKFHDVEWYKNTTADEHSANSMGLGPYKLVKWRRGIEVELEAFEDYKPNKTKDSQAPTIEHVIVLWRNETLIRAAMLETGEADWAQISLEDRERVPQVKVGTNNEVYMFPFDTVHHPELSKIEVREALNLATDCETMMEVIFDNLFSCFGTTAQLGTEGVTPENAAPYGYDPDRARELLKKANYNPENVIKLNIRSNRIPKDVEHGEAVVQGWIDVGVNAELHVLEPQVLSSNGRSNCGHGRTKTDFEEAAGATLHEKCKNLGPGKPFFKSMNVGSAATSTESLDFASRQGRLRNSCYGRSSGVCDDKLEAMMAETISTPLGPLRTERNVAVVDYIKANFFFHPNFVNVAIYGLAADLEWEPYYAPRIRPNSMRFTTK